MKKRPLSPHLQVYKPQITSVLSILHRISGVGLSFGLFFLVAWLGCLATSESAYNNYYQFMSGYFGQAVLFFSLLGFYYHFANGLRHLIWDAGYGFDMESTRFTGWTVVVFTVVTTTLTWIAL